MKFELSIRNYALALLVSLGLLMSALFSWQSAAYFLSAHKNMIELVMRDTGKHYQADTESRYPLDMHVTSDWANIPELIKQQFSEPPAEYNRLYTRFVGWIYFAPPEQSFSVMKVKNKQGQTVYVSKSRILEPGYKDDRYGWFDPMVQIALVGVCVLVAFILLLLVVFRSLAKPVDGLYQWVSSLSLQGVNQAPPPRFVFKELNVIANLNYHNIKQVQETLKREQAFLSYASHELRTPIATIRSNSVLLDRLSQATDPKEQRARDRIQRASLTMKDMTETLLWLSRDDKGTDIAKEECDIKLLIEQLTNELAYLLEGKEVNVVLTLSDYQAVLPSTVCRIVLTNLIRNAYQHTQAGEVVITQHRDQVTIINREQSALGSAAASLGFGLGTKLVGEIAVQFGWSYLAQQSAEGYRVDMQFSDKDQIHNLDLNDNRHTWYSLKSQLLISFKLSHNPPRSTQWETSISN